MYMNLYGKESLILILKIEGCRSLNMLILPSFALAFTNTSRKHKIVIVLFSATLTTLNTFFCLELH